MEAVRQNNRDIFESLTALGVPKDISLRFLINYRFKSIRNFANQSRISHTSVLKALRDDHQNVREIIAHTLFDNFNPF